MVPTTCWRPMYCLSARKSAVRDVFMAASWIILCSVLVICREGWIPARLVEETCQFTACYHSKYIHCQLICCKFLKYLCTSVYLLPGQLFSFVLGWLWRSTDLQAEWYQCCLWSGELGRPMWKEEQAWGLHTGHSLSGLDQVKDSSSISISSLYHSVTCQKVKPKTWLRMEQVAIVI